MKPPVAKASLSLTPHRGQRRRAAVLRWILVVAGVTTGVAAFAFAAIAFLPTCFLQGQAGGLLSAAGGLGALAFGVGQVIARLDKREGDLRKAQAVARLARRSLVEMANRSDGVIMNHWIGEVGTARSLDPVLALLRALLDLAAERGGPVAARAERALQAFLIAADHINPLFAKLPQKLNDFGTQELAHKGKILGALLAAEEALADISPRLPDEPTVKDKVRIHAQGLDQFYGWVQLPL